MLLRQSRSGPVVRYLGPDCSDKRNFFTEIPTFVPRFLLMKIRKRLANK
jgi:hypothetical protein